MFEENLIDELARRIGSNVGVMTSNSYSDGILGAVTPGLALVIEDNYGYGNGNTRQFIPINSINCVHIQNSATA